MNYPDSITRYFQDRPERYTDVRNIPMTLVYAILAILCLAIAFKPSITSFTGYIFAGGFRFLFGFGGLVMAFLAFMETSFRDLQTGGKVKDLVDVRIDVDVVSEHDVVAAFERNDFETLAQMPQVESGPMHFEAEHDAKGKIIYCQLRKYFSTADFRGITEVKIIEGADYEKYYKLIKSI